MFKYRFEVVYEDKWMTKVSDYMKKMDLGMDGIGVKDIITFSSQKDLSVFKIKIYLQRAFEECECKLIHIEGGKVE